MQKQVFIKKASGAVETFDSSKLHNSLTRARANKNTADAIVAHIEKELKDGMTTTDIYHHAFELLQKTEKPTSVRYSLRKAVMALGPGGFAFEKLVAEIFRSKGFETETDVIIQGECVPHEVDVVAWNKDKLIIVEAKFHNDLFIKSDIKVALYVKARFDDLANTVLDYGNPTSLKATSGQGRKIDEGWIITNTKFSDQAIHYAECKGMKLVGWNYPKEGNLEDLIIDAHLHPITCLTSINQREKGLIMEAGIVLCKQALENQDILLQQGIDKQKIADMVSEINLIQK